MGNLSEEHNKDNLFYITSLKGIAACIIVMHHYAISHTLPIIEKKESIFYFTSFISGIMEAMAAYGLYAVDMFFFFAGFLSIRKNGKNRFSNVRIDTYLGRKLKRIWPLLFVNVSLMVLAGRRLLMPAIRNLLLIHCGYFKNLGGGGRRLGSWSMGN